MVNESWSDQKSLNQKQKFEQAVPVIRNCLNSVKRLPEYMFVKKECFIINNLIFCQLKMKNNDILFGYEKDVMQHLQNQILKEMSRRLGIKETDLF